MQFLYHKAAVAYYIQSKANPIILNLFMLLPQFNCQILLYYTQKDVCTETQCPYLLTMLMQCPPGYTKTKYTFIIPTAHQYSYSPTIN